MEMESNLLSGRIVELVKLVEPTYQQMWMTQMALDNLDPLKKSISQGLWQMSFGTNIRLLRFFSWNPVVGFDKINYLIVV